MVGEHLSQVRVDTVRTVLDTLIALSRLTAAILRRYFSILRASPQMANPYVSIEVTSKAKSVCVRVGVWVCLCVGVSVCGCVCACARILLYVLFNFLLLYI